MSMSVGQPCWEAAGGCGRRWERAALDPGTGSQQKKESQTGRDQDVPLKVLEKERQTETRRPCVRHLLWPFRGQATQGRKLDLEVGLDHKLQRISRIKLNEGIQHVED